jgi:hypothetical protein|tara:strand:+ start:8266 stop:8703 length:438 start_codon:yes stop_codon:yes gene_type:complete
MTEDIAPTDLYPDEGIRYLKLVNGEQIIAHLVDMDEDSCSFFIKYPIEIIFLKSAAGCASHFSKWIIFSDKVLFEIPACSIVTMTKVDDKTKGYYKDSLSSFYDEESEGFLSQEVEETEGENELTEAYQRRFLNFVTPSANTKWN